MGVITDLENRLRVLANFTGVSQVIFDDIEEINADAKNNYPLLLFKEVSWGSEDYRNTKEYSTYKIDFYLADLFYQGDSLTRAGKHDFLKEKLDTIIKSIGNSSNNFELLNESTGAAGESQHNDSVYVVKITASIKAFSCITKVGQ